MPLRARHWKQRFSDDAQFVWNKNTIWFGKDVKAGDPIPDALAADRARKRRFWEAGMISLNGFQAPDVVTGQLVDLSEWRGMPYWAQVKIARGKGLSSKGMPKREDLTAFLEGVMG